MKFVPKKNEGILYLYAGSLMMGWVLFVFIANLYSGSRTYFLLITFLSSFIGICLIYYIHLFLEPIIPHTFGGLIVRMLPGFLLGVGIGSFQSMHFQNSNTDVSYFLLMILALVISLLTLFYSLETKEFTYVFKRKFFSEEAEESSKNLNDKYEEKIQ